MYPYLYSSLQIVLSYRVLLRKGRMFFLAIANLN